MSQTSVGRDPRTNPERVRPVARCSHMSGTLFPRSKFLQRVHEPTESCSARRIHSAAAGEMLGMIQGETLLSQVHRHPTVESILSSPFLPLLSSHTHQRSPPRCSIVGSRIHGRLDASVTETFHFPAGAPRGT